MHMEKATTMMIGNWKRKEREKPSRKMLIVAVESAFPERQQNPSASNTQNTFLSENVIRVLIITAQIFKQIKRSEESGGKSPRCVLRL